MRAGDFVCLAYGSGNRDERQYPNADVYDIGRKPRGHLGFGGGVHACLGSRHRATSPSRSRSRSSTRLCRITAALEEQLNWMPSSTFRSPLSLELTVH